METSSILQYTVVLLAAAVIAVPIAKRFELGSVLGYLVAGAVIGPAGLKLLQNPEQISQISELGVVLLLFVIGLELSPQRLWVMRRMVFGVGFAQVVATAALISLVAYLLFDLAGKPARPMSRQYSSISRSKSLSGWRLSMISTMPRSDWRPRR